MTASKRRKTQGPPTVEARFDITDDDVEQAMKGLEPSELDRKIFVDRMMARILNKAKIKSKP